MRHCPLPSPGIFLWRACWCRIAFSKLDLRDKEGMDKLFASNKFSSVIHFAGLKAGILSQSSHTIFTQKATKEPSSLFFSSQAVGESVEHPLWYYSNNMLGTVVLLETMEKHNVKNIVG